MITLFSCDFFFKIVSFLLYQKEVKMLKCAMLEVFTVTLIPPLFSFVLKSRLLFTSAVFFGHKEQHEEST